MYDCSINECLKKTKSCMQGLEHLEAEKRLKQNGKNQLKKTKKHSVIKCFFKQFLNIMVIILLLSAIVSVTMAIVNKQREDLFEGFVIFFIVIMNAIIGVFQETKAQACLEDLQKYCKTQVHVLRGNQFVTIDSTELVVGDIVQIRAGDIAQADIRLIEDNSLCCDESSLTGESVPSEKNSQVVLAKNTALADRVNMVYSGSMITNGKGKGVVIATGQQTEIGKIADMIFTAKKEITPLQKSINKIGKIITWVVLCVCAIVFILEIFLKHGIMNAIMISISLAVAAIPESLPAVITIIMALGVQQLAKRKSIIKRLNAVETLGCCEIICTDKTGTLTQNKMQVQETYCDGRFNDKDTKTFNELLKAITSCTNVKQQNQTFVGEPTEVALIEYANKFVAVEQTAKMYEIPFSSTRKMMSVLVNDNGIKLYCKGAIEKVLAKCKYAKENGQLVLLNDSKRKEILSCQGVMADKALRVIAFAEKEVDSFAPNTDLEQDMIFLGMCGMIDSPRVEVLSSIKKCFSAGLKPIMITGDNKQTAFAIAKQLLIAKNINQVMTGEELDKLSDNQLAERLDNYTVYARVSPEHKVRIVKAFKSKKKIVAMTGDGVNDAPSLKIADIGIGMGKSGTDIVKNVADMVVTDDNFASIVVAVEEGRKVYSNIQKALLFLISTNCVEVFGMLLSLLIFPQYTFLLPAQMLFINLVTDSLPAFALGMEKVESEVMQTPPRNSKKGLFAGKIGVSIIYQSILQTVIVILLFVIGVVFYSPEVASTMVFFTIIFMQTLHSLNCKTIGSLFDKKLNDNKTFNLCFAITMIVNLIVACCPFLYPLFNLKILNVSQWIMVVIASVSILPLCEIFKLILFNKNTNNNK